MQQVCAAFLPAVKKNLTSILALPIESVSMKLRLRLFKATLRQDISFFDETENSTGSLTSAISQKPQQINSAAGMTAAAILQSVITLSVGLIIAFVVRASWSKSHSLAVADHSSSMLGKLPSWLWHVSH